MQHQRNRVVNTYQAHCELLRMQEKPLISYDDWYTQHQKDIEQNLVQCPCAIRQVNGRHQ